MTGPSSEPGSAAASLPPGRMSIERFGEILGAAYDAALDPNGWGDCLEMMRVEFSANYTALVVRPGNSQDMGLVVSAGGQRKPIGPSNPEVALSPFTGMPPDRVVTVADVLSEKDWRASAYYRDWCASVGVFHVIAADVRTNDGSVYGFRVTRPETAPAFSEEDLALARQLVPHIKRALNLHLSVHQDRKVSSLYSQAMAQLMIGVVVLDQKGEVLECNPAATAILQSEDGLRVLGKQLEATYANDNRKLQKLVRHALLHPQAARMELTEAISVARPSGQLSWGVVVQSISSDQWTEGKQRPSVAVFVRDTAAKSQPPTRLAQQLFQLTPAETALAIQLANGLSLDEAAEALNIRRNTARAHLRSIFSKTGVRRQTELVRIFLNSVAWLGSEP